MPFDVQSRTQDLLIDGKRVPAVSGRYFETLNPATEQVLARMAEADAADIDLAVRSSRAAFEGAWGHMRAADRGHALLRLADLIRQNLGHLRAVQCHAHAQRVLRKVLLQQLANLRVIVYDQDVLLRLSAHGLQRRKTGVM